MGDEDIDLYADVESEFANENFSAETRDLYDDVLTKTKPEDVDPTVKSEPGTGVVPLSTNAQLSKTNYKKHLLLIGNLTWWTTDLDILEAVEGFGVNDVTELKFFENRINGQSKGFCTIAMESEASLKTIQEKMPQHSLHGHAPIVTFCTKMALQQFESQSKTRAPPNPQQQQQQQRFQLNQGGVRLPAMNSLPPTSLPPPFVRGPPPPHVGPPPIISVPPPGILPPVLPVMGTRAPPPSMIGPPPVPSPHVNPAFFAQGPPPAIYSTHSMPVPHHGLTEYEFEEIMARNKTVATSAISRAVEDASSGDFGSAIETLVTAISLIKQSKVSNDDRCKVLVTSLQDALHGIEERSYSRHSRVRSRDHSHRSRRRSYSRERDHRERDYREYRERERSRSRDRDFRRVEDTKYFDEPRRDRDHRPRVDGFENIERERHRTEREGREVRGSDYDRERVPRH